MDGILKEGSSYVHVDKLSVRLMCCLQLFLYRFKYEQECIRQLNSF